MENALIKLLIKNKRTNAPIAQSGEYWIAELTGSESPVRATLALAVCSHLGLPVSRAGRTVSGYVGTLNFRL